MSARTAIAAGGALVLLLAGCTVGPDYQAPPVKPETAGALLATGLDTASPEAPPDEWWHLYEDPVLDALLTEAFAANTDLRVATASLEQAQGFRSEARAARLPTTEVTGEGVYGRDEVSDAIASTFDAKAGNEWTGVAGFSVAYELDLFGRVQRSIEAAEADTDAVAALRDAVRASIAAQVTRVYAEICTTGNQLSIARQSLDFATQSRDFVRRQRDAGAASALDLARAEGFVEQNRAALPGFEGRRRADLYQLAALLGRPPADAPEQAVHCATPPAIKSRLPIGDGAALLARRPDVRQAERKLAAASARIGVATTLLYPRITLVGSVSDIQNRELTGYSGMQFGLGPLVSWTLPNIAVARARIREANAADAAALAGFDGTVLQALKETEQALSIYGAELDRHAALKAAEARALEALRLAEGRRAAGALSYFELLTVQQTATSAAAAVAASDALLASDQVDIFRALGGGWRAAAPASQADSSATKG